MEVCGDEVSMVDVCNDGLSWWRCACSDEVSVVEVCNEGVSVV